MLINDLALFGRISLAAGLGFGIGWEREVRGHPAGSRTFALVCAGSAGLTAIAMDAFPDTAEKLIAGIVTGVGFIGAGIVLRDPDGHVRGLTTAAAIWAITAVGVIAGTARLLLSVLVALLYVLVLEFRSLPLVGRLDAQRWIVHSIGIPSSPADLDATRDAPRVVSARPGTPEERSRRGSERCR
jgi:putative Mg2+ transporter-C (MgtC) family protein